MAKTPEESEHTSIKKRTKKAKEAHSPNHPKQQVYGLLPFAGNPRQDMPEGIQMRLTDYLDLVDWTGRQIRDNNAAQSQKLSQQSWIAWVSTPNIGSTSPRTLNRNLKASSVPHMR